MLINRHINLHNIRKQDKFVDFLIGFDFKGNTLVYAYFEFGKGGERDCNAEKKGADFSSVPFFIRSGMLFSAARRFFAVLSRLSPLS